MLEIKHHEDHMDEVDNLVNCERRNGGERRKKASPGFACITIVGWICRREQIRRKDDLLSFCGQQVGEDDRPLWQQDR